MRKIVTFWAFASLVPGAIAQKTFVATGGSASSLDGYKISYSVGQIAISSAKTTSFNVFEGVQQPITVNEISIEEALSLAVELNVYPNPSSNTLNITRADGTVSELDYQLLSTDGALILSGTMHEQSATVSLQSLPAAVYMLRVTDGKRQRAYRIIKK